MNAFGAEMFEPLSGAERARASGSEGEAKPQKVPIIPVPDDAPPMQYRHPKHGHPSASWAYRDAEGRLVGYACRFDFAKPDGTPDKDVLPVTFCDLGNGKRAWRSKGIPEPRPLYNLPAIVAAKPISEIIDGRPAVLVCEGEKAADAAAALLPDLTATTPMHGAKSPAKADWSPLRAGGSSSGPTMTSPAGPSPSMWPGWRMRPVPPSCGSWPSRTPFRRSGTSPTRCRKVRRPRRFRP